MYRSMYLIKVLYNDNGVNIFFIYKKEGREGRGERREGEGREGGEGRGQERERRGGKGRQSDYSIIRFIKNITRRQVLRTPSAMGINN